MENASEVVPEQVTVSLDWSDADAAPTQHVNQLLAQVGPPTQGIPDGIYLVIGNVAPPVITGTPEQIGHRVAALQGSEVKVTIYGRYHISRGFADAMIQALQTAVAQHDDFAGQSMTKGTETEVTS